MVIGPDDFDGSQRLDISVSENGAEGVIRKVHQIAAACQRLSPEVAMSLRGKALRLSVHLESVVKGAAKEALKTAVMSTPVDTGLARAGWTVKINRSRPGSLPTPEVDKDGQRTILEGTTTIDNEDREAGEVYWISNSQRHIVALERGHSSQAPSGMTVLAKQAANSFVRAHKSKKGSI